MFLLEEIGRLESELAAMKVERARLLEFIGELIIDRSPLTEDDIKRGQEIAKELGLESAIREARSKSDG